MDEATVSLIWKITGYLGAGVSAFGAWISRAGAKEARNVSKLTDITNMMAELRADVDSFHGRMRNVENASTQDRRFIRDSLDSIMSELRRLRDYIDEVNARRTPKSSARPDEH
jgi:hypothetical protein